MVKPGIWCNVKCFSISFNKILFDINTILVLYSASLYGLANTILALWLWLSYGNCLYICQYVYIFLYIIKCYTHIQYGFIISPVLVFIFDVLTIVYEPLNVFHFQMLLLISWYSFKM